jgi:pantetheine-phosphate adenylyltransferase
MAAKAKPRRIALYAGMFDPVTLGHLDIIQRAVKFVDHLVIGIAVASPKKPLFTLKERVDMLRRETAPLAGDG